MSALSDLLDTLDELCDASGDPDPQSDMVRGLASLARDELAEIHEALKVPAHLTLVEHARALAREG